MNIRSFREKKVLRVGVVVNGRVVANKTFEPGSVVTIGNSPDCDFEMQAKFNKHALFIYGPDESTLAVLPGMTYRLALTGKGIVEDAVLEAEETQKFDISPPCRGKVVVNEATFLFQFVDKPERPEPKPKKRTLRDWFRRILYGPDYGYLPQGL